MKEKKRVSEWECPKFNKAKHLFPSTYRTPNWCQRPRWTKTLLPKSNWELRKNKKKRLVLRLKDR